MNKPRLPGTFQHALEQVVETLGLEKAQATVGRGPATIYRWTDHDSEQLPNLQQALRLDIEYSRATGEEPMLYGMMGRLLERFLENVSPQDQDCATQLILRINALTGQLNDVHADITDPKSSAGTAITPQEAAQQLPQVENLMLALRKYRGQLEHAVLGKAA
jgi:hypothetical protein